MTNLTPGDPVPWFVLGTKVNPKFKFDTLAGRYIVLSFFGSAGHELGGKFVDIIRANRGRFSDEFITFFGVSVDPDDLSAGRIEPMTPGIRFFWDFEREVSGKYRLLGEAAAAGQEGGAQTFPYVPCTLIISPNLRVLHVLYLTDPVEHARQLFALMDAIPPLPAPEPAVFQAPILVVPNVFEPDFCRRLISIYDQNGGEESGYMTEVDGMTVGQLNRERKSRKDCAIEDSAIKTACQRRISRRLVPEIKKAYNFTVTRMERYIVACYTADDGGHFRAHRDNTTKGTAHRRFAVTINLNADYVGGDLSFPEYGTRVYRAPVGGAVVFGCSLQHEVSKMTEGRRFAFLPFLYDEEGARIREENNKFLAPSVGAYDSGRKKEDDETPPRVPATEAVVASSGA